MRRVSAVKTTFLSLAAFALAACASPQPEPKEPPLTGTITIASGECAGLCPVYTMTLFPNDTYFLDAGENTIKEGQMRGSLPVNSFRRAVEALETFELNTLQRFYTQTEDENCPDAISGLPLTDLSRVDDDNDIRVFVTFDTGCVGFADRDRLDQLQERLRAIFRVKELISVGEPPRPKRRGINDSLAPAVPGAVAREKAEDALGR